MKCDELIIYLPQDGPWGLYNENTGTVEEETCYLKSDVDEAIAELKQKLEDAQATAYAEGVDAGMRERRLKRAPYKACANWAMAESYSVLNDVPTANRWVHTLRKLEAKLEEYK